MRFRLVCASSWLLVESQEEMQHLVSAEPQMAEVLQDRIHSNTETNIGHLNVPVQANVGHQQFRNIKDGKIMM